MQQRNFGVGNRSLPLICQTPTDKLNIHAPAVMTDSWVENGTETSHVSSYRYLPLDARYGEIRLLSIPRKIPGSNTSVDYTLFRTADWDIRRFTALSYCWGDPIFDHDITVNGRAMQITESLATALISIQSEEKDILVWADALCINQRDSIEKTTQVQLMRDIYRAASQVIIWLGPSSPETSISMQGLQRLGGQLLQAGLWELRPDDVAHWEVESDDTSSIACTKRAVLQLMSEHLAQVRNGETPFWWIMSDLGKRKWFHASLHMVLRLPYLLCFTENMVYSGVCECQDCHFSLW
jgi:hypothetical protein